MMNSNLHLSQYELEITKSRTENEKEATGTAVGTPAYRFGLMDLWTIRRNSRKFRIHNRIPRL